MNLKAYVTSAFPLAFFKPSDTNNSNQEERDQVFEALLADPKIKESIYAFTGLAGNHLKDTFAQYLENHRELAEDIIFGALTQTKGDKSQAAVDAMATKENLAIPLTFIYFGVLIGKAMEHELHEQKVAHIQDPPKERPIEFASQD